MGLKHLERYFKDSTLEVVAASDVQYVYPSNGNGDKLVKDSDEWERLFPNKDIINTRLANPLGFQIISYWSNNKVANALWDVFDIVTTRAVTGQEMTKLLGGFLHVVQPYHEGAVMVDKSLWQAIQRAEDHPQGFHFQFTTEVSYDDGEEQAKEAAAHAQSQSDPLRVLETVPNTKVSVVHKSTIANVEGTVEADLLCKQAYGAQWSIAKAHYISADQILFSFPVSIAPFQGQSKAISVYRFYNKDEILALIEAWKKFSPLLYRWYDAKNMCYPEKEGYGIVNMAKAAGFQTRNLKFTDYLKLWLSPKIVNRRANHDS